MGEEKKETSNQNRRRGFARRSYNYSHFIPERRSGNDRRDTRKSDADLTDPGLLDQNQRPASKEASTKGKQTDPGDQN